MSDDYEVRRILAAAHTVSEAVGLLSHVDNMTDLLSRFKVMILTNQTHVEKDFVL